MAEEYQHGHWRKYDPLTGKLLPETQRVWVPDIPDEDEQRPHTVGWIIAGLGAAAILVLSAVFALTRGGGDAGAPVQVATSPSPAQLVEVPGTNVVTPRERKVATRLANQAVVALVQSDPATPLDGYNAAGEVLLRVEEQTTCEAAESLVAFIPQDPDTPEAKNHLANRRANIEQLREAGLGVHEEHRDLLNPIAATSSMDGQPIVVNAVSIIAAVEC